MPYQVQHLIPDEGTGAYHGGAADVAHPDDLLLGDNLPFVPMPRHRADGFAETDDLVNGANAPEGDWRGEHLIRGVGRRQQTQTEADAERREDARHVTKQALADGRWHRASEIADGTRHSLWTIAHTLSALAEEGICKRTHQKNTNGGPSYRYQKISGIAA